MGEINIQNRPLPAPWNRIFALGTRVLVWGLFFLTLYILRSFFLLIFLTFVFAYIQSNGVNKLRGRFRSRAVASVFVATLFLSVLIAVGLFLVPRVQNQAKVFVGQFGNYSSVADRHVRNFANRYQIFGRLFPAIKQVEPSSSKEGKLSSSPTAALIIQLLGMTGEKQSMKEALDAVGGIGQRLVSVVSAFLLALLFSFLIVLDLPKLTKSVLELRYTKVGFIYDEVAESVRDFAKVLGRAIEAQLFVAIFNTIFTAVGLILLGLGKHISFLSVIVFFCSFIPVAGVFISSVPICLMALEASGFKLLFIAIAMITVIHMLEAYVLNPKIYGSHLRMNPVVVLIILTIGGKLFHVWGLILGVPVCRYIFGHAIREKG